MTKEKDVRYLKKLSGQKKDYRLGLIAWHNDTPYRFPLMPKAALISSLHRMLNEGNSKKKDFSTTQTVKTAKVACEN